MTPEPKEIGPQIRFPNTLMGLFKKGCWHIPEIMCASLMALVGAGLATAGVINYINNDGDNKEYKSVYLVVRHDDPRAYRIKNPVCTEYKC